VHPAVLFALVGAFLSGTLVALQAPTNAMLSKAVGSPVNAAFISFSVGLLALVIAVLALGVRPSVADMRALPWYAWTGGLYGAIFVAIAAFAAPRIGVTQLLVVSIAGQIVMALILDKSGAFGLPKTDITPLRIAGVALVFAGVFLVRR
jgi:transporter family-2 protein